jgi:nuclear transcription factor Y, gamma
LKFIIQAQAQQYVSETPFPQIIDGGNKLTFAAISIWIRPSERSILRPMGKCEPPLPISTFLCHLIPLVLQINQGLTGTARDILATYWHQTINALENDTHDFKMHQLPLARIKKVMKADPEVKMISAEAPILFAKGCDIFITELTMRAWIHAEDNKRRTLQRSDIAAALAKSDMFDFLIDIVPRDDPHNKRPGPSATAPPPAAAAQGVPQPGGPMSQQVPPQQQQHIDYGTMGHPGAMGQPEQEYRQQAMGYPAHVPGPDPTGGYGNVNSGQQMSFEGIYGPYGHIPTQQVGQMDPEQ